MTDRPAKYFVILVLKYLMLSRQYTTLLCGGATERTVTDVSVVIYIIAFYCSRGVRKRSVCRVCVRACMCVCVCTVNEIRRRRKWNNCVERSVWQWTLPLSVGRDRVKSVTWRDHAPLCLASLFADLSARQRHFLFKQNSRIAKNFLFRKSYGVIIFGESYYDDYDTNITRGHYKVFIICVLGIALTICEHLNYLQIMQVFMSDMFECLRRANKLILSLIEFWKIYKLRY